MSELDNIIIFPTLKKSMEKVEEEINEEIKAHNYENALMKIDFLLSHHYPLDDVYISQLICYIKLNRLTEAEQLCEKLLSDDKNKNYYEYLEYYIIILYERNKFTYLIDILNEEESREPIPTTYKNRLQDIYRLAYQMNVMEAEELLNELKLAVKKNNHTRQWYILNKWMKLNVDLPERLENLLTKSTIHPALKTLIIEFMISRQIDSRIQIEKFGKTVTVQLNQLKKPNEHPTYQKTLSMIQNMEQENPTLYSLMTELLYQFIYIRYPALYPIEDVVSVAEALIQIGTNNLSLEYENKKTSKKANEYIKMIQLCSELFLTIRAE